MFSTALQLPWQQCMITPLIFVATVMLLCPQSYQTVATIATDVKPLDLVWPCVPNFKPSLPGGRVPWQQTEAGAAREVSSQSLWGDATVLVFWGIWAAKFRRSLWTLPSGPRLHEHWDLAEQAGQLLLKRIWTGWLGSESVGCCSQYGVIIGPVTVALTQLSVVQDYLFV